MRMTVLKKSIALSVAVLAIGAVSIDDAHARAGRHRNMAIGAGVAALVGGLMLGNAFAHKGRGHNQGYNQGYHQPQYYDQTGGYGYEQSGYEAYETVTVYQPVTSYRPVKVRRPVQVYQQQQPHYYNSGFGGGFNNGFGW